MLADLLDQLVAVHAGHAEVRDQQVGVCFEEALERRVGIVEAVDLGTFKRHQRAERGQQVDRVVDQHHAQAREGIVGFCLRGSRCSRLERFGQAQPHGERRPALRAFGLRLDPALVRSHQFARQRQSDAEAAASPLRRDGG